MEIDRSTKVQVAVGVVATAVFVVAVLLVGGQNGGEALTPADGLAMVGVLTFFVLFVSALGVALSGQLSEE